MDLVSHFEVTHEDFFSSVPAAMTASSMQRENSGRLGRALDQEGIGIIIIFPIQSFYTRKTRYPSPTQRNALPLEHTEAKLAPHKFTLFVYAF